MTADAPTRPAPEPGPIGRLPILMKIMAAVVTVAIAGALVGVVALSGLNEVAAASEAQYRDQMRPALDVGVMQQKMYEARVQILTSTLTTGEAQARAVEKRVAADEAYDAAYGRVSTMSMSPALLAELDSSVADWQEYRRMRDGGTLLDTDSAEAARDDEVRRAASLETRAQMASLAESAFEKMDRVVDQLSVDAQAQADANAADAASARTTILVTLVAGILAALSVAFLVARSITRRLRSVADVLDQVSDGDLTARCADVGGDEVGKMAGALNSSLSTIHDVIHQIELDAETLSDLAGVSHVGGPTASGLALSTSDGATELSMMADNLNAMISIFHTEEGQTSAV
jgi:methyl-accepting chemotaxis protein